LSHESRFSRKAAALVDHERDQDHRDRHDRHDRHDEYAPDQRHRVAEPNRTLGISSLSGADRTTGRPRFQNASKSARANGCQP
jgi:hypothetical protein